MTAQGAGVVLDVTGLTKQFGGLTAVDAVDFRVQERQICSLIGPNGAGKTTFFNMVAGQYEPTSGDVIFDGRSLRGLRPHQITARGIGRTFQNIRLFTNETLLENVLVGMHSRLRSSPVAALLRLPSQRREEAEAHARAMDLLKLVRLDRFADESAGNLPYGMQRRLEMARALASQPKLLLLDEPTAGMNPQETLAMTLRYKLGLTGTKLGCDREECGACTVLIDDVPHYACSVLTHTVRGKKVVTIEGLASASGQLHPVQQAVVDEQGFQCAFCMPGFVTATVGYLKTQPNPTRAELAHGVSGNLCRCQDYDKILTALMRGAEYSRRA